MEYERWILEEDILDFEFDGRGYRFEPEYTEEEYIETLSPTSGLECATLQIRTGSGSL